MEGEWEEKVKGEGNEWEKGMGKDGSGEGRVVEGGKKEGKGDKKYYVKQMGRSIERRKENKGNGKEKGDEIGKQTGECKKGKWEGKFWVRESMEGEGVEKVKGEWERRERGKGEKGSWGRQSGGGKGAVDGWWKLGVVIGGEKKRR